MWLAPKATPLWILLLFPSLVLVTSCTIQKRLYTGGYSIEWHGKFKEKHGKSKSAAFYSEQQPDPILQEIDSTTDHVQAPDVTQDEVKTTEIDSLQVASAVQKNKTLLKKKSFQIRASTDPGKPKKKLPTRPKPPKQRIHDVGVSFFDDAFFYTDVAVICLIVSFLFLFLYSVVTFTVGANIFLVIAIISLSCLTTYIIYVLASLFFGLCYMLVFWIWKLIYKHKKRIYDEWVEAHS